MNAKKMIGLLYRNYYQHLPDTMLLQLYKSLVRPHQQYAAAIWSPSSQSDNLLLDKVHKFALRMVTKCWDLSYIDLLDKTGVLSFEKCREVARLCLLYNSLCFLYLYVFSYCTSRSYHSHPFPRTNSMYHSFVPASIRLWNSLDSTLCSEPSFSLFKRHLIHFYPHGNHVSY